jgi:hypothetical protein
MSLPLIMIAFIVILIPSTTNAQADIQGILGDIPFDNNLEESCKQSIFTSKTVMEAFRVCGGLMLMAANVAPVSAIM